MLSNPFMPNAGTPPQTGETRPHLLAIEERLAEDRDGAYRREVTDRLAAARADLRRTIDQGVPPDEFRRLQRVLEAFDAAQAVIDQSRT